MIARIPEKGRYWASLIYPESCPANWRELMKLSGLRLLVSPLHDHDVSDEKPGEFKKPHRHVIGMWPNTTTRENAGRFFEQFGGPKTILRLQKPGGMARYLIHMDDPDKARYSPEDVLAFNGADWAKIALSDSTDSQAMSVVKVIEEQQPNGYYELLKLCEEEHPELVDFTTRQTVFCREVIWSFWHGNTIKR